MLGLCIGCIVRVYCHRSVVDYAAIGESSGEHTDSGAHAGCVDGEGSEFCACPDTDHITCFPLILVVVGHADLGCLERCSDLYGAAAFEVGRSYLILVASGEKCGSDGKC